MPLVADARDYFANNFKNLDTGAALMNLGGFLIDFVPIAGNVADFVKAAPKEGKFVVKYADDTPKVVEAIVQTSKQLSKEDDALAVLIRVLPSGSVDNIVKAIQKGEGITFSDYKKLKKALEDAGHNIDDIIDGIKFKNFRHLKSALGNPGEGKQWHHLVEQCQAKATRSGFQVHDINSVRNIRATPNDVHEAISTLLNLKLA